MLRKSFLHAALAVLAGIGLCACPPVTSKIPVGTTLKSTPDTAINGIWKGRFADNETASFFSFIAQDDGTFQGVIVTPPSAKDKGGWGAFSVQTVTDGPYHYMNAREIMTDGKPASGPIADNTFPILYRFGGDGSLVLYLMDEEAAKAAIKAGKIQGTVAEGQFGDATLTAPPGALDAFMASPAARALFTKPMTVLRRVR